MTTLHLAQESLSEVSGPDEPATGRSSLSSVLFFVRGKRKRITSQREFDAKITRDNLWQYWGPSEARATSDTPGAAKSQLPSALDGRAEERQMLKTVRGAAVRAPLALFPRYSNANRRSVSRDEFEVHECGASRSCSNCLSPLFHGLFDRRPCLWPN